MTTTTEVFPFAEGRTFDPMTADTFEVFNPSTGAFLFRIPRGSDADINRAVTSARMSFDDGRWWELAPSRRKETLHRFADLIAAEAAELDRLDAEEMGKPVSLALANAQSASELMRFHAEAIDKLSGDVFGSDSASFVCQRWVPRGVVAAIAPWNFPTHNAVLKVAPALAAGNSIVLKPSELSSRSALRLAQLALEAGLPPGVFNVVPGLGETVGRCLGLHRDVDMITFTGSTRVGGLMLQYAGQSNMKTVVAECGGKSPQIVFDDGVDLEVAADAVAQLILANQGQICSAGTRLLVQRSIESELIEKIVQRFDRIVVGDPLEPETTFGPLVTENQCQKVMCYIETAVEEGAERVVGGQRLLKESGGYFVAPTLFRNVRPDSRLAREEIFGPVLSVTAFDREDEAIQLANGTRYGLMAYAWTADMARGMRLARKIRSPLLVSAAALTGEGAAHAASWEPAGQSGLGVEGGMAGLQSYLRRHLIGFNFGE